MTRRTYARAVWRLGETLVRYFINIISGEKPFHDSEGAEFASLDEAKAEAIATARDVMAEDLRSGRAIAANFSVEIVDAQGQVVATLSGASIALGD